MRVKSPEELVKALEYCANNRFVCHDCLCQDCPYSACDTCIDDIMRDAAETIRLLLIDLAIETEAET